MKLTKIVIIAACAIAAFSCAPKAQEVSGPSALDVIMSRKSVRTYTDQALTDAQIETLLRAAMAAPTGMNVQPWRFVVVRDQAVKDALAGPRGGMVAQAPCVIVVCGETTMSRPPFGQQGGEAQEMENPLWVSDCGAATENLLLAAEAMGLGAVWTGCYPLPDRMPMVKEALNLPENVDPFAVVPIGYPAGDDQPKDKWKPENIHYDRW